MDWKVINEVVLPRQLSSFWQWYWPLIEPVSYIFPWHLPLPWYWSWDLELALHTYPPETPQTTRKLSYISQIANPLCLDVIVHALEGLNVKRNRYISNSLSFKQRCAVCFIQPTLSHHSAPTPPFGFLHPFWTRFPFMYFLRYKSLFIHFICPERMRYCNIGELCIAQIGQGISSQWLLPIVKCFRNHIVLTVLAAGILSW